MNVRGTSALIVHMAGMLAVAFVMLLVTALGDRGELAALLALALPLAAFLLAPFGGFVSPRVRAAIAWASVPWVLGVGWLTAYGTLAIPMISRTVVPIGEPSPLAPLVALFAVPVLGFAVGALRLRGGAARAPSRRLFVGLFALGLLSNVAASATQVRPDMDAWVESYPLVLTVPAVEGRQVHALGEGRMLEVVQEAPYGARAWVRHASETTPCAWRPDVAGANCAPPVQPGRGDIEVRRFDGGWLVGDDAITHAVVDGSGEPMDVTPTDVAHEVAIPAALVAAGWLGWLLALAFTFGLPRTRELEIAARLEEPWRSLAAFHRPAAVLLLLFSQAPLVAAWLLGF